MLMVPFESNLLLFLSHHLAQADCVYIEKEDSMCYLEYYMCLVTEYSDKHSHPLSGGVKCRCTICFPVHTNRYIGLTIIL